MAFLSQAQLLEKADGQLSDLAPGGLLVDEQAARFIMRSQKKQVVVPQMRVETTTRPRKELPKTGFTGTVSRPAQERTALTEAERVRPDNDKVVFEPVEFIAETRFNQNMLEDNIEGDMLAETIVTMLTEAIGRDIENIVLNGNTAGTPGQFLSTFDGLIVLATSNVVVAGGVTLAAPTLRAMFKIMEAEYLDKGRAKFYTSKDAEEDFRATIAARQTANGDQAFGSVPANTQPRIGYGGVEVVPVPLMPENLGGGGNETVVLLMDPKNAVLMWRRMITLEREWNPHTREWSVICTYRIDTDYLEELAVAKATGVLAA